MDHALRKALGAGKADHIEIRLERRVSTSVHYVGRELEDIGTNTGVGGCVRALVNGGWGFVSFNDASDLSRYVKMACEQARTVGAGKPAASGHLAPVQPAIDSVKPPTDSIEDPRGVPLEEKEALAAAYNKMILSSKNIQTSTVSYRDYQVDETIANTDGQFITQETVFCGLAVVAIARDGMNVQRAFESVGDLRGFGTVRGQEATCEDVARRAVDLLSATQVTGGKYTVLVDPKLCGVFVHEAFGHLSESDFLYENPDMLKMMTLGKRFGGDELSIVDDPTIPNRAGTYKYDSEGTPGAKTYLIGNGILSGHLHSRETAARMGEQPTGNARAISYNFPPIVRMSNTYLEPRGMTFDELIAGIDNGIYAVGALGGMTEMEMFTFSAGEAYAIRGGKIAEKLRDVVLTGNVKETLANIDGIGNDLEFYGGLGGCGKGGQSPLRVSTGGPHVRIRNVVIGGR
ncbi:MAG TPA: TldD/PmbA family protein [Planctomycetota bacterium]|nr:TldD/PmbA family protein [Planctomycetota bacterium]